MVIPVDDNDKTTMLKTTYSLQNYLFDVGDDNLFSNSSTHSERSVLIAFCCQFGVGLCIVSH